MAGRPLSLNDPITWADPLAPEGQEPHQITKGEAIIRTVRIGVPRYVAATASGVDPATLRRWEAAAAEVKDLPEEQMTDNQRVLCAFCAELQKADAEATTFAVAMVKRAMPDTWQAAMTFLERRFPREWSKRVEIETNPPDREQAPLDPATVSQVEEAFRAAAVPEGITPESILPAVGE